MHGHINVKFQPAASRYTDWVIPAHVVVRGYVMNSGGKDGN